MFGLSCILVMLLSVPNHFNCFASDSSAECSDEGSHTTYNSSSAAQFIVKYSRFRLENERSSTDR